MERILIGRKGEAIAAQLLQKKGFEIIQTNWRNGRCEIDLIGRNNQMLVFAEVKTRTTKNYGDPLDMVSKKQRNQIMKAANQFIIENKSMDLNIRFDIISVLDVGDENEVEHIEEAFYPMANQIKLNF